MRVMTIPSLSFWFSATLCGVALAPALRAQGKTATPPLTELPAAQCQALAGTAGFHCYEAPNGWVLAKSRRHAEIAARDIARLGVAFQRYFAKQAPRFAVVVDTNTVSADMMAHLRSLGAQGALPWPIDPIFERLGVMTHELGHLYYLVAFPGHGASWMKEASAILMERPQSTRSRYQKLAGILRSPHQDEMIVPLARLFTMPNPGHPDDDASTNFLMQGSIQISGTLGPSADTSDAAVEAQDTTPDPPVVDPPDGRYEPATVFYEECRSVIDFLIEQSGDSAIFRAITDHAAGGTQMARWLKTSGARYHLPSSIDALDRAWRRWLAQNVSVRAGLSNVSHESH